MQVDFFVQPRLVQSRSMLPTNVNALAAVARKNGSLVIWVKSIFAADLHDASLEANGLGRPMPWIGRMRGKWFSLMESAE
jgi:nicotinamidase-related amidase